METPKAARSLRTRVQEYLRELAFDLLALHHRLFDPFDPRSMPDYRKELDPDFNHEETQASRAYLPLRPEAHTITCREPPGP